MGVAEKRRRLSQMLRDSGQLQLALGRLDAEKQAALLHYLEQLWIDNNLSTNGENHTLIYPDE